MQVSREPSPNQSVFFIMVYINRLISGTSVCVCFCYWFLLEGMCVCVDVCVVCLPWPLFPPEKGDSKTHLKIYTHSVRSPVHSSKDAPAVLGKMPRNIQGCVNHNSPLPRCACCHIWKLWFLYSMWLTQNLHFLDTSIDFPSLWIAVMDGVAMKSSAGQVVRVTSVEQYGMSASGCSDVRDADSDAGVWQTHDPWVAMHC